MYNEIYNARSRWSKDPIMYQPFGTENTMFTTLEYRKAKQRRDLVTSLFSRKAVLNLQGVIQEGVGPIYTSLS